MTAAIGRAIGKRGDRTGKRPAPPGAASRTALRNLSLGRKVALIPALTLLLMGMMLAVAMQMGERNTGALRVLDRDVFEPLNRAQTLKDEITLLHTRLFALLSIGNNETNPAGPESQRGRADRAARHRSGELQPFPRREHRGFPARSRRGCATAFRDYAGRVRETASFAAYDASYGVLVAGITDDKFGHLRADLDTLVQSLAQRRAVAGDRCRRQQCRGPENAARSRSRRHHARPARFGSCRP